MAKKANKKNCEGYKNHMMYNPQTGKGIMTKSCQEHLDLSAKGFSHEKPKMKKKAMGGQVQGCGCPYGMQIGPNSLL